MAAPWFTELSSAETAALDAGGLLEDVEVELVLELLDEHAASSNAVPTAVTMEAIRAGRGFRLPIVKRSMRPRTVNSGSDQTAPAHRLDLGQQDVNGIVNNKRVSLRSLSPDQHRAWREVVASPHFLPRTRILGMPGFYDYHGFDKWKWRRFVHRGTVRGHSDTRRGSAASILSARSPEFTLASYARRGSPARGRPGKVTP
jgi:hypothetical protein